MTICLWYFIHYFWLCFTILGGILKAGETFSIRVEVRDGSTTRLWHDHSFSESPLWPLLPMLSFRSSSAMLMVPVLGTWAYVAGFNLALFPISFGFLHYSTLTPGCLEAQLKGTFTVWTLYLAIATSGSTIPAYKAIWLAPALLRVRIHMWLACRNKLLTVDNFGQAWKGPWSMLCDNSPESVDHIFISCPFTQAVWLHLQLSFNLPVLPDSTQHLWNESRHQLLEKRRIKKWIFELN